MRIYYIFNINKNFSYLYNNKPSKIYRMLEEMYYCNDKDIVLSYRYFEQIAYPLNKSKINKYIINEYNFMEGYYHDNNSHIICNNYEYSKLIVTNTHIKIKSNINYPAFLNNLNNSEDNFFICDFYNKDYFWLNKINKSDCQREESIVK